MTRDTISLLGLAFFAYHGVRPEEQTLGQRFVVDLEAWIDLGAAGNSDTLRDTVNYSRLYEVVRGVMDGERHNLLESLGEQVAARVLAGFDAVQRVRVRIAKPGVPIAGSILREVAITIDRTRPA